MASNTEPLRWTEGFVRQLAAAGVLGGLGWRAELVDRWFTRRFGIHGLRVFGAVFLPLLALRPVVVLGVAASDAGTVWEPGGVSFAVAIVLVATAFQHAFIWAHYRWIERPDMQVIYEGRPVASSDP